MNELPIYTLGYAQWSVDAVVAQIDALGAVLVDVRQSPHTTKPGFAKPELEARFDDRYVHLPAFGNVNYQSGPIEQADPERGIQAIRNLERPPVLMCGCRQPEKCHRSTVAHLLADRLDGTVEHLRAPSERAQPGLFDNSNG
jgi:uncharacterized protein (DUF488 family)